MINLAIIRNIFINSVINTDIAKIMEISECKEVLVYAILLRVTPTKSHIFSTRMWCCLSCSVMFQCRSENFFLIQVNYSGK